MSATQSKKRQDVSLRNSAQLNKREIEVQAIVGQVIREYSGPLPPPDIMRGYTDLIPDAPERLLSMAEKEQVHRHEMDLQSFNAEISDNKRGMLFAFILCILALSSAVVIVFVAPSEIGAIAAAVLGASGFWSVARAMVINSKNEKTPKS